jgi:hypothetical protein
MFVPTPNKMYYCVLTNVVLVYITITWPICMLCPLQNITKLRLKNSRQKFSPTKNSLQNYCIVTVWLTTNFSCSHQNMKNIQILKRNLELDLNLSLLESKWLSCILNCRFLFRPITVLYQFQLFSCQNIDQTEWQFKNEIRWRSMKKKRKKRKIN